VDVLLPFHRNDSYLKKAFDSVCAQSGVRTRVILIDDRKDRSTRLVLSLRPQDEIISTKDSSGYGAALEIGSKVIESEFVALMNSDDVSLPTRFAKQLQYLNNAEVSIARIGRITSKGRQTPSLTGAMTVKEYDVRFLLMGAYGANATWCSHRDWWRKNFFADSLPALDWRIALRSFPGSVIALVPSIEYLYRRHPQQVTQTSLGRDIHSYIGQEWQGLSRRFQLPELSIDEELLLIDPKSQLNGTPNLDCLLRWFAALQTSTRSQETRDNLRDIFARRLIFASIKKGVEFRQRVRLIHAGRGQATSLGRDAISLIRNTAFE
jgi:glycosyltransferase involved in cell wall biosynthesis